MQRVLVFDGPKAARRFELCRAAVLGFGNGKGERTRDIIRKEARLLDAFDAISVPDPEPPAHDPDARILMNGEGPHTITIAQDDFALLEKDVDTTQWMPRASRDVVDVQDWLDTAEKIEKA